ncbi:MAG: AmmeMemoRadiSam system protein A [Spirochaetia bacterium]|nr:AmmeMemoRadiSam system protein A [Spirochaetia bacterium]
MIPGLTENVKRYLLELAKNSITNAVQTGTKLKPEKIAEQGIYQQIIPSFVTLKINHELRGCIGSLSTQKDLISDISDNAFSSAMEDPRFPQLTEKELNLIKIEISLLYDFHETANEGREHLIQTLQPGVSGLIIEENHRRATFLPSVWDILPEAEMFLARLLVKAGLHENYWSENIRITLYRTESF